MFCWLVVRSVCLSVSLSIVRSVGLSVGSRSFVDRSVADGRSASPSVNFLVSEISG